uniref:Peptidyl-prolyl cis-trans isomerase n=1 Tax=Chromera velia CCMP2878 TaxID=1169474 RepID=A0A0G4F565_9ALVE|eukprot:Cvel_15203.t1-p1 / transcript=Cvel_15203.t1 / gene=Cvel_15203 / organism=Chromera_velia_CCMP2878 / gene_product=Peptidyl-prolyl cis-trans isomerase-like 4, putative / transcript_product=Peptidyl-prolyl cis-trans isomerase-like 4, putative / location=Cvel_scaffold1112:3838-6254(-) / protein_length=493 / sequence_SO=supercontig / SO=protein_coding / is_pseudo=false
MGGAEEDERSEEGPAPPPETDGDVTEGRKAGESGQGQPERNEEKKNADEALQKAEAKSRAILLEVLGDIPDADMKPPENVLFVCKLNPYTEDSDLEMIFSRFGKIESCQIIRDWKTGDSLQYAFIEFQEKKMAEDAYYKMDQVLVDDRRIHVDFSQSVAHHWSKFKKQGARGSREDAADLENRFGVSVSASRGGGRGRGRGRGGFGGRPPFHERGGGASGGGRGRGGPRDVPLQPYGVRDEPRGPGGRGGFVFDERDDVGDSNGRRFEDERRGREEGGRDRDRDRNGRGASRGRGSDEGMDSRDGKHKKEKKDKKDKKVKKHKKEKKQKKEKKTKKHHHDSSSSSDDDSVNRDKGHSSSLTHMESHERREREGDGHRNRNRVPDGFWEKERGERERERDHRENPPPRRRDHSPTGRSRSREPPRDRDREHRHGRSVSRERDRDRDRERGRMPEYGRGDRQRDRSRSRERDRDRYYDRDRDRDWGRERGGSRRY